MDDIDSRKHVCPLENAGNLDTLSRRWKQHPKRLFGAYISKGMRILDIGCGPGFFTLDLARMTGENGYVIASDLQKGMLDIVEHKVQKSDVASRVILHQSGKNKIGYDKPVDFILAFYVIHEIPDEAGFFQEADSILTPGGRIYVAEPISKVTVEEFKKLINTALKTGFILEKRPRIRFTRSAIFRKC